MYDCIADVYDLLMKDVDYITYAEYMDKIINRYLIRKAYQYYFICKTKNAVIFYIKVDKHIAIDKNNIEVDLKNLE